MQRQRGLGNSSVKLKSSRLCKGVGKRENPLTPFLLFIVFLWDEKTDMLIMCGCFQHENVDSCMTVETTKY
jgi:hypothetical protein